MKILKIHIEQFGTFKSFDLEPDQGINRICRENGWGKTTLAVFIRAMLYGFPVKGERSADREKYRPWENGIYGGSLTFSAEGRTFTVYRRFGLKKSGSEDEFYLQDETAGRETDRWSRNLGEELLGINEESFVNSAWIRQDGCRVTGDMTSRLGGKTAVLEDLKQYDQVMAGLEKRMNQLSPVRKTGRIYKRKLEKQELEMELLRIPSLEKSISRLEKENRERETELGALQEEQLSLQHLQKEYGDRQDFLSEKKVYEALVKEVQNRREVCEKYRKGRRKTEPEGKSENTEKRVSEGPAASRPSSSASGMKKQGILFALGAVLLCASFPAVFYSEPLGLAVFAAGLLLAGIGAFGSIRTGSAKEADRDEIRQMLGSQRETEAARNADRELKRAEEKLQSFLEQNPGFRELLREDFSGQAEAASSLGELNEKLAENSRRISSLKGELQEQDRRTDLLLEERSLLTEKEEKLSLLREELSQLEQSFRIAECTAEYLKEAKEACSSRFREPVQRAFQRYYRMIDPEQKEQLYLDANLSICTMGGGLPRSEESLSSGYRNLAALCLRFALLDAMYERETPCVILDDPFLYFDDEKQEKAMEFLEEISGRYQILYFSCRGSS